MKMVKSLLLGSAAGLVAITAGQAADLPVKARPVEYVKICSLYGAGFYYMPGTDLCIKVGGWARAEITEGGNGSLAWGAYNSNTNSRATNNLTTRERAYVTTDIRNQTEYGTIRAYLAEGISSNDTGTGATEGSNTFSANRAFVQWAGLTAGLSQSFYDFFSGPAVAYRAGYLGNSDTGDAGWFVWAYTAQLGGGFSATLSAEQRRMSQIIQNSATGTALGGSIAGSGTSSGGTGYGGMQNMDYVANLRVDQAWGGAQIMGAAHQVNALYYGTTTGTGHPGDSWGFAVGAGLKINLPMITQGDWFQTQVNYSQGATKYLNNGDDTNYSMANGQGTTVGVMSDCVFGGAVAGAATSTGCNLTTGWDVSASYEHFWTPTVHESFFGAYMAIDYNAQANAMLCNVAGFGGASFGAGSVAGAGCNNNWNYWTAGTRLQWDVTKSFYLGVEALYTTVNGATTGGAAGGYSFTGANAATGPQVMQGRASDWVFTVRAHRDFLP
jgi:Porin subfamily